MAIQNVGETPGTVVKMPEPTVTITGIAVIASLITGVVAGRASAPNGAAKALEAQTAALAVVAQGNTELVDRVTAVALTDAERESSIAEMLTGTMPPMCIPELGGDVNNPGCMLAWCMRSGETDKQRCEQAKLTDLYIRWQDARDVSCPD